MSPTPTAAAFSWTSSTLCWLPSSASLHSTTLLPWIAVQINRYTQLFVSESASGETNPGKRSRWQHLNLLANLCVITSETIRYYILPNSMQQGVCMKYACQKKIRLTRKLFENVSLEYNQPDRSNYQVEKQDNTIRMQIAKSSMWEIFQGDDSVSSGVRKGGL